MGPVGREGRRRRSAALRARRLAERPEEFLAAQAAAQRAYQARNLHKVRAHKRVQRAVRAGLLVRPAACEDCGAECAPQAHHDNYDEPLAVRWLCGLCHGKTRRKATP